MSGEFIFALIIIGTILSIIVIIYVKSVIWDEPKNKIAYLERQIETLKNEHKYAIEKNNKMHQIEIEALCKRLNNTNDLNAVIDSEFTDILTFYAWKDLYDFRLEYPSLKVLSINSYNVNKDSRTIKSIRQKFKESIEDQYKYKYLLFLYPQLSNLFNGTKVNLSSSVKIDYTDIGMNNNIFEIVNFLQDNETKAKELMLLKTRMEFLEASQSNLTAIPYMAQIVADYETIGLETIANRLDWGWSQERLKKVKSIREIRKDARAMVEKNKEAQYQLAYLLEIFPNLQDVIECEFKQLPPIDVKELSGYDTTKDYLSKEEYASLSTTERNQLALDRYKKSHKKTKWQIGRDYELYIGYMYTKKGYNVDYYGSYMKLEDLGRDLICKKGSEILIVQCKYWSSVKQIHEKHITQLYGTMVSYCIENNYKRTEVKGVLVTNISLSDMAKKMAKLLKIKYQENVPLDDYPCIKCNIGRGEYGEKTKIYHLPFDQKYDITKIDQKGEFYAMTVKEAEEAGFRRAFKWFDEN